MKKLPIVSIIIVSYNTRELLHDCLLSLKKVVDELPFEIIVSDNGSSDGSVELIKKSFPDVILIENNKNLGYAAGNNKARKIAKGRYILFLNSDTVVKANSIKESVSFLDNQKDVGALTCKVVLRNGELDPDTRRSFPTPWIALTHFSGLDRLFPKSSILSRYWYGFKDPNSTHEIEVLQGAFCLVRKDLLDRIGWFDEDYFLDGEDIDLCWRIQKAGYKIIYYPKVSIIHVKGASKGKRQKELGKQSLKTRMKTVSSGLRAMETFYIKNMWQQYPLLVNYLVLLGIKTLKLIRITKIYIRG